MGLVTTSAAPVGAADLPPEATVTQYAVELDTKPVHRCFRLTRPGGKAALASQVRPSIVLPDREARSLLVAADRADVAHGGCFSAGPAGVQVWSGPWSGPAGGKGSSTHLGSVDWSYDTPSRHYITIYRVMVTAAGAASGATPAGLLDRVLALAGVIVPGVSVGLPVPPPGDPFRSDLQRAVGARTVTLPE
ncbi:MAG: hypothetical protein JWN08_1349 [Frankiales bacterium]|nr:hypothetical protein [Frankiales bacterium]